MSIIPEETNSSLLYSYNLENQIWREINTITEIRLLKEKIKKNAKSQNEKISDDFAEIKAKDIQFCIKQAKDYFSSSKFATLATKPTLIYYGIISLVASIIIYKNRDKSLNSMRESHGLKDKYPETIKPNRNQIISKESITEISAEIQESGTFKELSTLPLYEFFKLSIKKNNAPDTSKDFKQKLIFKDNYPSLNSVTLKQLFQNTPEIWKETKLSLNIEQLVFVGEAITNEEILTIRFLKELVSIDELISKFNFIRFSNYCESNDYYFFNVTKENYLNNTPLSKTDIFGRQYLTSDKNTNLIANDLIIYYLIFFIFGSLSRYKPFLWRYILEDPYHGLNTIPEILCESSYIKMPLYTLRELNNNFYKI